MPALGRHTRLKKRLLRKSSSIGVNSQLDADSVYTDCPRQPARKATSDEDTNVDLQQGTHDPFLDPNNVEAYVTQQLANHDLGYRRNKNFRWSYLDAFPKWRAARLSEQ
jgi:hypothetical protein